MNAGIVVFPEVEELDFAGPWVTRLAGQVLEHGLPADTFLNINLPPGEPGGLRLTRQGKRRYSDAVVRNLDPRGRAYYWIGGGELAFQSLPGTDAHAVGNGFVSVTPLHLDLTNYAAFERLRGWCVESASEGEGENA